MLKISQQSFCYNFKICWRYVELTFPTVFLWNKSQVKKKQKVLFFYSNKCKHEELTQNPETEKFEKHLMI